jgi:NADH-quinone oxidoreductase subunit J
VAQALFYVLSAAAVGFGVGVISSKQPLFSVLHLLGSFFCLAAIYLLAGFQFLAATQLLVYAGAIMVLFLFVIMLLNLGDVSAIREHPVAALGRGRVGVAIATAGVLVLVGVLAAGRGNAFAAEPGYAERGGDPLPELATVLFSRYLLPFEATSILLLATMVGVILLAKRQRGRRAAEERSGWPWQRGVEP